MATFFDEVKAIVLDRGTKASKIHRLCSELKCTVYEANTFYNQVRGVQLMSQGGAALTTATPRGARRFTIGVEIECFGIDREDLKTAIENRGLQAHITGYNHNDSKTSYKLGSDSSITGWGSCEVVSPILRNLDSLKTVCEVINEAGAQVNKSCGLHVHFGASKFTVKQYQRIIMNYAAIEPIIDSFMPLSRRQNQYCKSIRQVADRLRGGDCDTIHDIQLYGYDQDRYYKVNAMAYNTHKTIEFRQHQGTTNFEKIRNWVEFLSCFLQYSLSSEEPLTASTIDDLPFITNRLKTYYKSRKAHFEGANNN